MHNRGNCLCGAVTWEISAEPGHAYNCHCKRCRKAHGSAFGTYWFLQPGQFRWTSDTDTIVRYRSSDHVTRCFCGTCGSVVPSAGAADDPVVVPGGCHDEGKPPDCNIFVAHSAPWYPISGDLPSYDDYPPGTGYAAIEEAPAAAAPDGVVRGSCLCGGIEFHVTEPFKIAHHCHCSRCRHARAAAHATNGFTAMGGARFIKGENHLKSYKVPGAQYFAQVFCDVCGSKMPRIDPDRQIAVIPLGALDDDPGIEAADHMFVAFRAKWYEISDTLPAFQEGPV